MYVYPFFQINVIIIITGRPNPWIIESTHGLNQSINQTSKVTRVYKYTRLPLICFVKLSLNFELLVNRVMKFLLGQRLINNNIFCTTWIIPYQKKK